MVESGGQGGPSIRNNAHWKSVHTIHIWGDSALHKLKDFPTLLLSFTPFLQVPVKPHASVCSGGEGGERLPAWKSHCTSELEGPPRASDDSANALLAEDTKTQQPRAHGQRVQLVRTPVPDSELD